MRKFLKKIFIGSPPTTKSLSPVDNRGWITIMESFSGGWQTNSEVSIDTAFRHPTVFACVSLIVGDIGKLGFRVMREDSGIWVEAPDSPYSGLIRRPNGFQTWKQFIESWCSSKQGWGNTYILKRRDNRGVVTALYVLDPARVAPLISSSGDVFYALNRDEIVSLDRDFPAVPASEIIHDRMNCLFHPLVGLSPLFAGAVIQQGMNIQSNSEKFFGNMAMPSGMLTAPGPISDATAARLSASWKEKYSGVNFGNVAVAGDGLEFKQFTMTAVDSELVKQLDWVDEKICSLFKVPPYKVCVGSMPTYDNAEVLDRIYYSGCLQTLIESIEGLLDDGLGLPSQYRTEFDLEDLMRMDPRLKMTTAAEGVKSAIYAPDEARKKFGLRHVEGGDTPYMQQQNYSLGALAKRDSGNPLAGPPPPIDQTGKMLSLLNAKGITCGL